MMHVASHTALQFGSGAQHQLNAGRGTVIRIVKKTFSIRDREVLVCVRTNKPSNAGTQLASAGLQQPQKLQHWRPAGQIGPWKLQIGRFCAQEGGAGQVSPAFYAPRRRFAISDTSRCDNTARPRSHPRDDTQHQPHPDL
jgi:hypothetical protein